MIHAWHSSDVRRPLLLTAGTLLGLGVAFGTPGLSWEAGALGLGLGLAALVGLAQTCSA